MIQQTIDLAGWQQFISAAEVTAAVVALCLGWAGTEMLKRVIRGLRGREEPGWVWVVWVGLGFTLTLGAALAAWPENGIFPHPFLAALTLACSAPAIYAGMIWVLRHVGLNGLASAITGNRRRDVRAAPRGIERRRETAP